MDLALCPSRQRHSRLCQLLCLQSQLTPRQHGILSASKPPRRPFTLPSFPNFASQPWCTHVCKIANLCMLGHPQGRASCCTIFPASAVSAGMLGPTYMRPGEAALVAAVLGTGAAQEELVPALMHAYAGADHVVGLDVDRDRFDKFTFRAMIDGLLEMLWKDEGGWRVGSRCRDDMHTSLTN